MNKNLKHKLNRWLDRGINVFLWLCGCVLLWLFIQVFCLTSFYIPTDSMQPDLLPGDKVLVSKWTYGEWMNAKVVYNVGAYESAEKDYERLYPLLKDRAAFLFEYGHGLHKQQKFEVSNRILKEALKRSSDPMILNILGKNCQQTGDYWAAEDWLFRSTHRLPGRIYPYYLLAKLYAEPGFKQYDKLEIMKRMVLTKEPKVNSTAIREMREEVKNLRGDK